MSESKDDKTPLMAPWIPTIIIGDTHADLDVYRQLLRVEEARFGGPLPSIHVGDYGFGNFSLREEREVLQFHRQHRRHRFIRGNHDTPALIQDAPGFLRDGTLSASVLFLGGADGNLQGKDTEITKIDEERILARLDEVKSTVSVVISHDAPQYVAQALSDDRGGQDARQPTAILATRTRSFLAEVAQILQPQLWIFGHWHFPWEARFDETHFRAVGFQESFVVPLPWDPEVARFLT